LKKLPAFYATRMFINVVAKFVTVLVTLISRPTLVVLLLGLLLF